MTDNPLRTPDHLILPTEMVSELKMEASRRGMSFDRYMEEILIHVLPGMLLEAFTAYIERSVASFEASNASQSGSAGDLMTRTVTVRWTLPIGIADLLTQLSEWNSMLERQTPAWHRIFGGEIEQRPAIAGKSIAERIASELPLDYDQRETVNRNKARGKATTTVSLSVRSQLLTELSREAKRESMPARQYAIRALAETLPRMLADSMMLYITRSKALADEWDRTHASKGMHK